jgi:choline dehydrogenase-like flavoprotein
VYDYVVVGAGSAGCVVAARLGEDPDVRVLLLDAGPPDTAPEIHLPVGLERLWHGRFDWGFVSEPEPGLADQRLYLPRGRVLGGSSSLNAMLYVRGNRADYDAWEAMGLAGWGYEDTLPYFKKAEDNERGESYYHGAGGPLSVSDGRSKHRYGAAMIEAAAQAGIAQTDDHNGATQEGVGWFQVTQRNGRRCSTALAYLASERLGPNVEVLTDTYATRVLIEGDRAVGVEVLRENAVESIRAQREVIVCAGAYQSPQLLLLSGIGPADELRAFGIEPRADLAVGRNLQDHPVVTLAWLADGESLSGAMTRENIELFEREGRGPLTSTVVESGAFVRTRPELDAPDIQLHFFPVALPGSHFGPGVEGHGYTIGPTLLHPSSRGAVTLRNSLAHTKPRIVHNYLTTEEDRRSLIDGVRLALEIGSRPALAQIRRGESALPRSESDADILDFIAQRTQTIFHPVGTCAMGAVVDAELRVLGVRALRVVDASVMPMVPRGNTNAPTIMLAEKAADMIRGRPPLPRAQPQPVAAAAASR